MGFTGKLCEVENTELSQNNTIALTESQKVENDKIHELTSKNLEKSNNKNRCLDENMNPCFDKVRIS